MVTLSSGLAHFTCKVTAVEKEQMLALLEEQKNEYVAREGYREYSCLLALVEDGVIGSLKELAEYGVEK